uniref:Putative secreted protein n=1 Tax=Amblyomma aureolatum TaxID=187763 RepID=A0A1E1X1K8_9ACAR
MSPTKMLFFAVFAGTLIAMFGRSSALLRRYYDDVIRPCHQKRCYIGGNGPSFPCPEGCQCIPDGYPATKTGIGRCFTNRPLLQI